jgi:putative ABC transport system permease protein
MRTPRWFAELGPARLVLAALALLAAGTAATTVAVPADTKKSDTFIASSVIDGASWPHRDLVLSGLPVSTDPEFPKTASDIGSVASANLAALPYALNRLVSQTSITRQYDHLLPALNPPAKLADPAWLRFNWAPALSDKVRWLSGGTPGKEATKYAVDSADGFITGVTMTVPIAVSEQTADRLGLTVGTVVNMNTSGGTSNIKFVLSAQVAGIFEPGPGIGPDDPIWHIADKPDPVLTTECLTERCDQAVTVWESDIFVGTPEAIATTSSSTRIGEYTTTYDYVVDPTRLTPSALSGVGTALDQAALGVSDFKGSVQLNTGLKALAETVRSTQSDSHQLSAVVLGALSAGALAALFLMLRLTVLRRARDVSLCRARGASPVRLALRHATQVSTVVALFGVLGVFGAVRAGRGTLRDPAAWSGAVLVTLLTFGVVCYSVLRADDRVVSARHEAIGETARTRRIVRDVGLLLAAGGALAIYRSQGSANPDGSIDWIAVAAPALLAFAAGIAAVRLVPALFGPVVRLLGRRRSTVGFVAAALAGRRVRVVAAPLAGLVVVVAAGMFAAGYDASVTQKVRDDAVRSVGAAARIDAQPDRSVPVAQQASADPTAYQFSDAFAAAAAKVPGVRNVFTGRADIGGIAQITPDGTPQPRPITVITMDAQAFRRAAAAALSDDSARGQGVPASWPAPRAADGTVTVLASPSLAGLFSGPVSVSQSAGAFKAVIGAFADVPLADSVEDRGGTDYVVVPAGEVPMVDPGKPNIAWFSGDPGAIKASALRALPGVTKSYDVTTFADVESQTFGEGRVSAARDVFHLVEALCVGYFALCLLQLLTATRAVSRDSALLLQVFGLRARRGRLVATLVPLPVAVLAVAAGLGMGAGLAPMLGSLNHGPAGAAGAAGTAGAVGDAGDSVVATGSIGWGWTVPVVSVALAMTVGGVLLDQLLRRRMELSVRLRDAEFE